MVVEANQWLSMVEFVTRQSTSCERFLSNGIICDISGAFDCCVCFIFTLLYVVWYYSRMCSGSVVDIWISVPLIPQRPTAWRVARNYLFKCLFYIFDVSMTGFYNQNENIRDIDGLMFPIYLFKCFGQVFSDLFLKYRRQFWSKTRVRFNVVWVV